MDDLANQIASNRRELEAMKAIQKTSGNQIYKYVVSGSITVSQTSTDIAFKWFYIHAQSYDGSTPMATMGFTTVDNRTSSIGTGGDTVQYQQSVDNVQGRVTWWIRISWRLISGGSYTVRPQVVANMPVTLTLEEGPLEYDND